MAPLCIQVPLETSINSTQHSHLKVEYTQIPKVASSKQSAGFINATVDKWIEWMRRQKPDLLNQYVINMATLIPPILPPTPPPTPMSISPVSSAPSSPTLGLKLLTLFPDAVITVTNNKRPTQTSPLASRTLKRLHTAELPVTKDTLYSDLQCVCVCACSMAFLVRSTRQTVPGRSKNATGNCK